MNDTQVARVTGIFAIATVAFSFSQFPLYMLGNPTSFYDGAALARHLRDIETVAFTRILLDQGLYVCMMIFVAGFRHLVRQARPDCEWLGTLLFGSAVVWLAVTLVADGLAGGATLDAISSAPDRSAVRALTLATLLIYNSSTAFVVTGLFMAIAGIATLATGVLPRWTGWFALVTALLCGIGVTSMYGGPASGTGWTAGSFLPALIANFPPLIWFLIAGLFLLLRRRRIAERPATGG